MHAPNDNTAPRGLRAWWASPPRSGMQRIIAPPVYHHLRGFARVAIGAGIVLVGLGAVTLVGGSFTTEAVWWTAFWLVAAAVNFATAAWYLTIARSASARP
jgi:hypothetical protein